MRRAVRKFAFVLAAGALLASGSEAGATAEQSCAKEKLKAIGKAIQCRLDAVGVLSGSERRPEDSLKFASSLEKCKAVLAGSYGSAEKRYGAAACSPSGTADDMNSELEEATKRVAEAM